MSKRKNQQPEQYFIFDKKNNRKLQVSKQVHRLLNEAQETGKQIREDGDLTIKTVSKTLSQKHFTGIARDMKIQVCFTEDGKIDDLNNPKVEIINKNMTPEEAISRFIMCEQEALGKRNDEIKRIVKEKSEEIKDKIDAA